MANAYRGTGRHGQKSSHDRYIRDKLGEGLGSKAQPWKTLKECEDDLTM